MEIYTIIVKDIKCHKSLMEKECEESFGMLYVPWKYFKEKYKF